MVRRPRVLALGSTVDGEPLIVDERRRDGQDIWHDGEARTQNQLRGCYICEKPF